jgi:hypothetical protein
MLSSGDYDVPRTLAAQGGHHHLSNPSTPTPQFWNAPYYTWKSPMWDLRGERINLIISVGGHYDIYSCDIFMEVKFLIYIDKTDI